MRHRKAFTLVELLVVIGVIALLISVLMPALNSARSSARLLQCSSNFKQVYNGLLVYAQENKGFLPPSSDNDWEAQGTNCETFVRLSAYMGSPINDPAQIIGEFSPVFVCVEAFPVGEAAGAWAPNLVRTIQWNPRAFPGYDQLNASIPPGSPPGQQYPLRKLASIRKAADKIAFYEATQIPGWNYCPEPESIFLDGWRWSEWSHMYLDPPPPTLSGGELTRYQNNVAVETGANVDNGWWSCSMRFRHQKNKAMPVAFFDGHVETRKIGEIRVQEICINPAN